MRRSIASFVFGFALVGCAFGAEGEGEPGGGASGPDGGATADAAHADADRDTTAPDAPAAPAATCPDPVEVVVYGERDWNRLGDAFAADPSPCADYFISIPAIVADKTFPRGGAHIDRMRARGPRHHALAEFHWTTWSNHVADTGMTWYDAGVEFRRRMADAGYDVALGDAWAINELPSSVRSNPAVRANARNAVRGLHDGPPGAAPAPGAVFIVGMGQKTVNFSVYKPAMKGWLQDTAFWTAMDGRVRWWGQEVYVDADHACVGAAVTGARAQRINQYAQHVARLAEAGGAATAAARAFLDDAYTPILNAAWRAPQGYGNTDLSLAQMKHHVSTQVYAARAWAGAHAVPDGRVGFAWSPRSDGGPTFDADATALAARLAASLRGAYGDGGGARFACSPSGAYTWCQCTVAGASFNAGWDTFATW